MSEELPFDPFPFAESPHVQTVLGTVLNFTPGPQSVRKLIHLPDGDRLSAEITTPKRWKSTDLTVVLVHGLCGSHEAPYLVRMAKRLEMLGIRAVRFNMRGCGSGRGLAKKTYHCGSSGDVFECLKVLKKEHPDSPIVLVGFSLGGNIVLKLAGELGSLACIFLSGVIAISPPVELYSSVLLFSEPANSFYESYFYKLLRADVYYRHHTFKDLPPIRLPNKLKIYEFDQIYTAPISGFANAEDYYNKCSSIHLIGEIQIPCKILLAEDDPIISHRSLDNYKLPSNVSLFKTKKGGHMGYLGRIDSDRGFYWLDSVLEEWIQKF